MLLFSIYSPAEAGYASDIANYPLPLGPFKPLLSSILDHAAAQCGMTSITDGVSTRYSFHTCVRPASAG